MKKLTLLLLLTLTACFVSTPKITKPDVSTPKNRSIEISYPKNSKVDFVNVIEYQGFTDKEKEKALQYIPVMNATIGNECFKRFMLDRKIHSAQDKTNAEVVKHLRSSKVDITLIMYNKRFSKAHGYTYPGVSKIWLNRKYHKGASLCSEASNLAHELSHKLKYTHSYKSSKIRPHSVPYSINAAFKACCK